VLMNKIERISGIDDIEFKSKRGQVWMQNNKNMSTKREEVIKYLNVAHTFKTIWKE